jgi:hypothetical protein
MKLDIKKKKLFHVLVSLEIGTLKTPERWISITALFEKMHANFFQTNQEHKKIWKFNSIFLKKDL